jgi:oxygen-independent coproporphyrinogen-3 oxidase
MQNNRNDRVNFDADLIARYDGRGPRYTSYPAAPQFSADFTVDDYRRYVQQSNADGRPLSIYVHIPFCSSLCYYCGCNKIVTRNQQRIASYLGNLHREIDLQSQLFEPSRSVEQLHFGGGTPTYLSTEQLTELMHKLASSFAFAPQANREFSIEVDPRSITTDSLAMLAELGFNRLSLGIQDFDPQVQIAVNRRQSEASVADLLAAARDQSFKSVSFDLIYGLPLQTPASFENTLQSVVKMRPDRLAVYNYAHLPERFKGQRMIDTQQIPAPEVKLELLHMTIDTLCDAGYCYVGMDHFALPDDDLVTARHEGTLQRNFQGYSTHRHCDLIGLGASSIAHIGSSYSQNALTTMEYETLLQEERLPIRKGIAIDADDLLRAEIIQSLMCYDELRFADIENRHSISFPEYFGEELQKLAALANDGLVDIDNQGIRVTASGRLLMRNIAMQFDRHLASDSDGQRFSKAI